MKFNTSLAIVVLAVLVNIQSAIGHRDISIAHMFPASWIDAIVAWHNFLAFVGTTIMGALAIPGALTRKVMGQVAAAMVAMFLMSAPQPAHAADSIPTIPSLLPVKAPALKNPFAGYTGDGHCGAYYGFNVTGSTAALNGTNVQPGTQVVQGGVGGTLGYGCPINATNGSFWFAEVMADVTNFNGASSGLALNGPASFTERFGVGSPLNNMLGSLPGLSGLQQPAVPSLPGLPAGITAGTGAPYVFLALHQQDVGISDGLAQNREWLLSWGVGAGLQYRLSNNVVADVSAEYKAATQTICAGPLGAAGCEKVGQGAFITTQFKY